MLAAHRRPSCSSTVRENPASLVLDPSKELRSFRLATSSTLGTKRGRGRGSFIDSVLTAVDDFYAEVHGTLRAWSAAPPKLRPAVVSPPEIDDSVSTTLSSTDYSSQDGAEVFDQTHGKVPTQGEPGRTS